MPKIWLLGRAMRRAPTQKRIKGANSDSILAAIMLITLVIVDELVLLVSSAPYCLSTAGGVQRLPHRDVDSKRPRKQKLLIVRYTTLFVDMGFSRRVSSRFGFYLNASQGSFSFFLFKRYGGVEEWKTWFNILPALFSFFGRRLNENDRHSSTQLLDLRQRGKAGEAKGR